MLKSGVVLTQPSYSAFCTNSGGSLKRRCVDYACIRKFAQICPAHQRPRWLLVSPHAFAEYLDTSLGKAVSLEEDDTAAGKVDGPYTDQILDRQQSPAGASTSNAATSATQSNLEGPKKATASRHTLSLTVSPDLVRPNLPRRPSEGELLSDTNLLTEDSSGGTPSVDRGPAGTAGGRVYWRGSVTSREAVLGRMLVHLPAGASVAGVLAGQMLSSKQITR